MDMGRILAVFNDLQNNNMSATPNDQVVAEGHVGQRDAAEAGRADAYYGRPCKPNKSVNGEKLWGTKLTPKEHTEYTKAYKSSIFNEKNMPTNESKVVAEGFIGGMINKAVVSKQAKAAGYAGYKKTVGPFLSQIMMDKNGENLIVRVTKEDKPFKKFHVENSEELPEILKQADSAMSRINESAEQECPNCTADGVVPCQDCRGNAGNDKCKKCFGEGETVCNKCNGQGYVKGAIKEDVGGQQYNPTEATSTDDDKYKNNLSVTTSYDRASNQKSITVTAYNNSADELMNSLKLSGVTGSEKVEAAPAIKVDNIMTNNDDLNKNLAIMQGYNESIEDSCSECGDPLNDAAMNHGSGKCANCALDYSDREQSWEPVSEDTTKKSLKPGQEMDCDKTKTRCKYCGAFKKNGKCPVNAKDCGRNKVSESLDDESMDDSTTEICLVCGSTNDVDSDGRCEGCRDEGLSESLSPKRENTGLNGAPRTWHNTPNEQIAGWKALIQDTDGLSQPHDMFNPVKGSDNIMTVAANKKDEKLHEDKEINALAEALQKKFQTEASTTFLNQIDASDCLKFAAKEPKEKKTKKEKVVESRDEFTSAGAAVARRISSQHQRAVSQYGLDAVEEAIHDVTDHLTELDEIGSSDVSIWTGEVLAWLVQSEKNG